MLAVRKCSTETRPPIIKTLMIIELLGIRRRQLPTSDGRKCIQEHQLDRPSSRATAGRGAASAGRTAGCRSRGHWHEWSGLQRYIVDPHRLVWSGGGHEAAVSVGRSIMTLICSASFRLHTGLLPRPRANAGGGRIGLVALGQQGTPTRRRLCRWRITVTGHEDEAWRP